MADNTQVYIQMGVGDTVPLGTLLANLHIMGVITDPNTPNQFAATLELFGDQGVLTVPVLQGPEGKQGSPQFALRFQNDTTPDPDHLPTDLTDTDADIGKYWVFKSYDNNGNVIGTTMFVWYGSEYRQLPVGSQGPPGPYPIITPTVNLIDENRISYISVSGPKSNPQWQLHLAVPQGPIGPASALSKCPDVDLSNPPNIGQVLGFSGRYNTAGEPVFQFMDIGDISPRFFTIPESAFQAYSGISATRQTVCTWEAPKLDFPCKPKVEGQLEVFGFELKTNPFLVGAEVRLGDPNTGTLIGRGFGNSNGSITIVPHASTPNNPNTAISPTNNLALIPAGTAAKIYVNLYNDGMAAVYDFDPTNAQLSVEMIPIGVERATPTAYFGTLGVRTALSATWELGTEGS